MRQIRHFPTRVDAVVKLGISGAVRWVRGLDVADVVAALISFGLFAVVGGAGFEIFGVHWWVVAAAAAVFVALKIATENIRPYVAALGLATLTASAANEGWGWPVWLGTAMYLTGLVTLIGVSLLVVNIWADGFAQVYRNALDRIHPSGEYRRRARRHAKLLRAGAVSFPIFALVSPRPIHRELRLKLSANARDPLVISASVIDRPFGDEPSAGSVRVETWPPARHAPPAPGDDQDDDHPDDGTPEGALDIGAALTTLMSNPEAASIVADAWAPDAAQTDVTWNDVVRLGQLMRSQLPPQPADRAPKPPPMTIAVDGNPEPFAQGPFGNQWRATGTVRRCKVEVTADAPPTDALVLQEITDPVAYLHPGRACDASAINPPPAGG